MCILSEIAFLYSLRGILEMSLKITGGITQYVALTSEYISSKAIIIFICI